MLLVVLAWGACTFLVGLAFGLCLPAPGRKPVPPKPAPEVAPAVPTDVVVPVPDAPDGRAEPDELPQPEPTGEPVPLPQPNPQTTFPGWNSPPSTAEPTAEAEPEITPDDGPMPPVAGPGEGRRRQRDNQDGEPPAAETGGEPMSDGEG